MCVCCWTPKSECETKVRGYSLSRVPCALRISAGWCCGRLFFILLLLLLASLHLIHAPLSELCHRGGLVRRVDLGEETESASVWQLVSGEVCQNHTLHEVMENHRETDRNRETDGGRGTERQTARQTTKEIHISTLSRAVGDQEQVWDRGQRKSQWYLVG